MSFGHADGRGPTETEVRAHMKVLIGVDPHKASVAVAEVDLRGPRRLAGGIDVRRRHLGCVRPIERPLFLPGSTPQMRPLTLLLRG